MSGLYIHLFQLMVLILNVLFVNVEDILDVFHQHEYQFAFEWLEVTRYNKIDLKQFDAITFKHNRTCTAANVTFAFNIDVGNDLDIVIQANKFVSNEYRRFPAIRFQINMCNAISKNVAGLQRMFQCGNFSGCPIPKGRRNHYCNFTPDESKLPPFAPSGRYMFEVQGVYHNTEMFMLHMHATISRPIVKK